MSLSRGNDRARTWAAFPANLDDMALGIALFVPSYAHDTGRGVDPVAEVEVVCVSVEVGDVLGERDVVRLGGREPEVAERRQLSVHTSHVEVSTDL